MSFGGKRGKFSKLVTIFELYHETSLSRKHFHSSASASAMLNILLIAIIRIDELVRILMKSNFAWMHIINLEYIKLKPALHLRPSAYAT